MSLEIDNIIVKEPSFWKNIESCRLDIQNYSELENYKIGFELLDKYVLEVFIILSA